ncbi:hypothetical protein P3X46_005650 [Hevea brasiliensis]|uniref:DUF7866 domain-containing protein n=1 Tax=Hevea brasiliensis TaxID=3981 RepID=A0ABQ9N0P3_HEVBR|nr:uncharacterized protein LOC110659424 [Hevea brasiliensis]KAJ9186112.1 hypothetical protein P3X46_005650 [Hevea brasiliensis]
MSAAYGVTLPLILLLLLLANVISYSEASTSVAQANGSATTNEMVPLMEPEKVVETRMMLNESRRRLGSFQICALCTCCGGAKGLCLPSPCCYAINCNIPNRPFGFCSFTPKTCNCFGCHI